MPSSVLLCMAAPCLRPYDRMVPSRPILRPAREPPLLSQIQQTVGQFQCQRLGFEGLATIFWYKIANATTEVGGRGAALGKPYEPNGVVKNDVEFILRLKKAGPYRKPTPMQRAGSLFPPEEYDAAMRQVWADIPGASRRNGHPAPFPMALASRLIRMSSYVEDVVLDPFLGTGTTTAAAIETNRNSIGFEIAEEYWKAARERFGPLSLPGNAAVSFERS